MTSPGKWLQLDRCRSHGINAQVARQVEQTCQQILHAARQQRLQENEATPAAAAKNHEPLRRCLMAGFADQLARRRAPGGTECDLTDQRQGQLVRESVVQDALFRRRQSARDPFPADATQPRHRRRARMDRGDVPAASHHQPGSISLTPKTSGSPP